MTLLRLDSLQAGYGDAQVLHDVSLEIAEGEAVALLGRNGMGKSTTIRVICRLLTLTAGSLAFDNRDISRLPAHRAARLGLGLVPEGRRCFAPLTVRENLIAAARPGSWTLSAVTDLFPRLGERLTQKAASLSGGEQQMLAIGRALMTNPRLLILDEATEGLAPKVRAEIRDVIAQLRSGHGMSFLIVDKPDGGLRSLVDRAVILERGRTVWTDRIDALGPEVSARYLGV